MQALLRKHADHAKSDIFEIADDKKKYFYIDTSEYMNYSNATLGSEYHTNHGPQPEGEALNASWQTEVDAFLRGEPNHLKDHPRYLNNYPYEFKDKSFPTAEAVADLMHGK